MRELINLRNQNLPSTPPLQSPRVVGATRREYFEAGWLPGPAAPIISREEVHLWRIDLTNADAVDFDALSDEELERGARFHFEKDRIRFKIARAALRTILGRYAHLLPDALDFCQNDYGKPSLTNPRAAGLHFNLSHSKDVALLAVTREREVGIDVEFMRPDFATTEVAEHFFSSTEVATLAGVEFRLRPRAFFNCWTRKEAYIKARGEGLSLPLNSFDVSLKPGQPATLLNTRLDSADVSRWSLHELFPVAGYAAAVAVERCASPPHLRHFSFAE
jgi:4'-phosphopantetheinyl transferase